MVYITSEDQRSSRVQSRQIQTLKHTCVSFEGLLGLFLDEYVDGCLVLVSARVRHRQLEGVIANGQLGEMEQRRVEEKEVEKEGNEEVEEEGEEDEEEEEEVEGRRWRNGV